MTTNREVFDQHAHREIARARETNVAGCKNQQQPNVYQLGGQRRFRSPVA